MSELQGEKRYYFFLAGLKTPNLPCDLFISTQKSKGEKQSGLEASIFCVRAVFIRTDQLHPVPLKDCIGNEIRGYLCQLPLLGGTWQT